MLGLAAAEEPAAEIIVEAHRDIEVYVAPIEVIVATDTENIEASIDSSAAFTYSSSYSHNAQIERSSGRAYEPVGLNHGKIKVYSEDTIIYAWDNCNYKIKPLGCSIENSHYYLETTVHVDDNELVVRAILFDMDAQVIATGTSKDKKIIRWIKQQEIQQQQTLYNQNVQGQAQRNCDTTSCSPGVATSTTSPMVTVTTTKPKEEMPLKWVIPHRLLDRHVQQAMLLMWCSTKLDIY
tara:strand:- start:2363 stop:3073 length:711 start_codon:yes stop_codon:yes gene_type:complete